MSDSNNPQRSPATLPIIGLDHLVLRANDPGNLIHFYSNVLGCAIERELPEYGLVQLRAGNALIDIVGVELKLANPSTPSICN